MALELEVIADADSQAKGRERERARMGYWLSHSEEHPARESYTE